MLGKEKISTGEIWIITLSYKRFPAVIVSSNEYNDKFDGLVVAPMIPGTEGVSHPIRIDVDATHGFIACENVLRIHRRNLVRCVGRLPSELIRNIESGLEDVFGLGYIDDVELERLKSENARLKREVLDVRAGIMSRIEEVARYKRLYDKAVDQIADMTLAADVARRIAEKTAAVEEEPESEEPEPEEEVAPVEEAAPEETVTKITFPVWEPPVEEQKAPELEEKVNVNEATMYELMEAGFGKSEAARISRWVRKYGRFKNLDDLTKVDGVTGKSLRKIRDRLTV